MGCGSTIPDSESKKSNIEKKSKNIDKNNIELQEPINENNDNKNNNEANGINNSIHSDDELSNENSKNQPHKKKKDTNTNNIESNQLITSNNNTYLNEENLENSETNKKIKNKKNKEKKKNNIFKAIEISSITEISSTIPKKLILNHDNNIGEKIITEIKEELYIPKVKQRITQGINISLGYNIIQSLKTYHKPQMTCIIILRKNNELVSCGLDKKINFYEVDFYSKYYELKKTIEGHENGILYIKEFYKYNYLCSCSLDKTLKLWNLSNYECIFSLVGHKESVLCCDYSSNFDLIFSGSEDKNIIIWGKSNSKETYFQKKILKGHEKNVESIIFIKKYSILCSGSEDRTIRIWDKEKDFNCIRIIFTNYTNFSMKFAGKRLISCCEDGNIIFIDITILQKIRSIKFSNIQIYDINIFKDKEYLLIGCGDGKSIIWRVSSLERDILEGHKKAIIGIIGLNNERIITGSMDGLINVWENIKVFPKENKIKKYLKKSNKKNVSKISEENDEVFSSDNDESDNSDNKNKIINTKKENK